jgi:hypothetical protein
MPLHHPSPERALCVNIGRIKHSDLPDDHRLAPFRRRLPTRYRAFRTVCDRNGRKLQRPIEVLTAC